MGIALPTLCFHKDRLSLSISQMLSPFRSWYFNQPLHYWVVLHKIHFAPFRQSLQPPSQMPDQSRDQHSSTPQLSPLARIYLTPLVWLGEFYNGHCVNRQHSSRYLPDKAMSAQHRKHLFPSSAQLHLLGLAAIAPDKILDFYRSLPWHIVLILHRYGCMTAPRTEMKKLIAIFG